MDLNWVAITVAILGSAGLGGIITSVINGVSMARKGIAGREDERRLDIVVQRDLAWARVEQAERAESAADKRADLERISRIKWQEAAVRLRFQLLAAGLEPKGKLPYDKEE